MASPSMLAITFSRCGPSRKMPMYRLLDWTQTHFVDLLQVTSTFQVILRDAGLAHRTANSMAGLQQPQSKPWRSS